MAPKVSPYRSARLQSKGKTYDVVEGVDKLWPILFHFAVGVTVRVIIHGAVGRPVELELTSARFDGVNGGGQSSGHCWKPKILVV